MQKSKKRPVKLLSDKLRVVELSIGGNAFLQSNVKKLGIINTYGDLPKR